LASSTSFAIARWVSRASVGCAIAFSCTVVSIATRSRSLVSIAPVRWATERLSCNSATICSSPSRWRQRVSDERSNGSSCRNTTSPQKYWKYGFSTHRSHSASSERLCICLRMNSPATSRVGNGGCPGPTRHTELKRPARKSQSISPASRTSGWRRLMISSRTGRNRSSWRSSRGWLIVLPRQPILPPKESRTTQIGNPKPQENPHAYPAFLQNRLLAQVKSSRSINRFRILHGRLPRSAVIGRIVLRRENYHREFWTFTTISANSGHRKEKAALSNEQRGPERRTLLLMRYSPLGLPCFIDLIAAKT